MLYASDFPENARVVIHAEAKSEYHSATKVAEAEFSLSGSDYHVSDREQAEANARLIAAAPDLLAALRGLLLVSERLDISEGVCCCGDDMPRHAEPMSCGHEPVDAGEYYHGKALESARVAIAKAEGA